MKAPILEENWCSVLIAEFATGIVFKKDLTLYQKEDSKAEVFQLFENFYAAESFVRNFINNKPEFECVIFNHKGEYLSAFDITGERIFV
ncbi:MAG: hypothetical protein K1X55_04175 [Chitinophagales bacterium]|nr:hypothetical protein [Chitinophagales bacterium]